jgi:iron(III) transport system ATP-binding protein
MPRPFSAAAMPTPPRQPPREQPEPPPLLTCEGLCKRYEPGAPLVVDGLSFAVREGEILALLGASGCGKTTTLRLVAGFETPDAGSITLGGRVLAAPGARAVPPEKREVGLVFQDYALFPHLSASENVGFGLRGLKKPERERRVAEALRRVGLQGLAGRKPHALSGGQQQRVALARALAPEPRLLLLDEPFSGLDAHMRQETRREIRAVLKRAGMTAVLVTHDQEEALSFADRVAILRGGRIEQIGTPEALYHAPRTLFAAQFLGRTNLLFAEAHGDDASTPLGRVPLDRAARGNVLVSLRPEHLTLLPPDAPFDGPPGKVMTREFKGHDITYTVDVGESQYLVHTHNRMTYDVGDAVRIRPLAGAVVLTPEG